MTKGSPLKIIFSFSLPMLLSMFFQQLYNIVDSLVAGNFIGMDALAAVGASYPITVLFIAAATGASIGCSVVVSQIFGARQLVQMKSAVSTAVISLIVLSLTLTGVGLLICNPLIALLNTPSNIFDDSALYLRIYICGVIFLFLYNTATAIFTGLGDSKTPLYFLIFSSIFNIVLDLWFVISFQMGVAGVAWATFIAQGLSSVLAVATLLLRLRKIRVQERYKVFDVGLLRRMSVVAIPSIMQQSFVSVGQLCVQGLINGFGSITVAGYSAAFKINMFAISVMTTMSSARSSFTAQNLGAESWRRKAGPRPERDEMRCRYRAFHRMCPSGMCIPVWPQLDRPVCQQRRGYGGDAGDRFAVPVDRRTLLAGRHRKEHVRRSDARCGRHE